MPQKHLLVICGPTASGKTSLSIQLAQHFDTEIVNADSRQVYHEMNIGTARPTPEELAQAKHHLVDFLPVSQEYNAKQFEKDALVEIDKLFEKKNFAILAGGSGLYIRAVCEGFDEIPDIDPNIRAQLNEEIKEFGLAKLLKELETTDPIYYGEVDKSNPQRVLRSLEVKRGTGKPFSSYRNKKKAERPFNIIKIGLDRPREELYERINLRMDLMLEAGLLEEAKSLYPFKELNALQTVGYSEIFDFLDGKHDWEEAVRLLKRNSRRYAKRQMTWFRKEEGIRWFHPEHLPEIISFVENEMKID
ncbi:tRNA (adenosine(37)-N6)-dimethylallyltransferase MiaA [Flammeovirgaceae bacterium SG7u.111]|nr:tRNA (adenosine(37)-N6)-dimethylallyltransferase MiaA [Flammeovirgaceae bacterium SG7u.132]WPO36375.1 tRNA (adenosine(37)-N6)-dimethylallyltransferase MiaA [Flammeovirgaceae bacterium SG7u.111]